jgi:hypothetical protein
LWSHPSLLVLLLAAAAILFEASTLGFTRSSRLPGLLAPSDSLRSACASIARDLPRDVKNLRVFARPSVTFYLGQSARVSLQRQPGVRDLFGPGDASTWALIDLAIIRQDQRLEVEMNRFRAPWILVSAFPTSLSLPVLLDIEPSAAATEIVDAQVELRLFRPRRAGDPE